MEGCGRGGVSPGVADVKEEPARAPYQVFIKEEVSHTDEVSVKQEPKCASSADSSVSETGAGLYAHVVNEELVQGPRHIQQLNKDNTRHTFIKEEARLADAVCVKEEPKCESSADSCERETGAGLRADYVGNEECVPEPRLIQQLSKDNIHLEESNRSISDSGAWAVGSTRVEHDTAQNTFTHTRQHNDEANTYEYACDTCGRTFQFKYFLIRHLKTHMKKKSKYANIKYPCSICKKKFRKNYLKIHERIHASEKPYACEVCYKKFTVWRSLKDHKRIHTEESYDCDICHKSFGTSAHLKRHQRCHSGERPYKCDICKKGFAASGNLESHMRTHTGEKPYTCEICKKGFTQLTNLNKHIRLHAQKPYSCTICNKNYRQHIDLKDHIKTHTGEHPYACDICKKTFTRRSSLKEHKMIHSSEWPFSCEICKRSFRNKSYSKIHKCNAVNMKKPECETNTEPCGASETRETVRVKKKAERESSAVSYRVSETGAQDATKEDRQGLQPDTAAPSAATREAEDTSHRRLPATNGVLRARAGHEPAPRDTNTDTLTPTVQSKPGLRLWCPFNTRVVSATRETEDTSHRRLPATREPTPQEPTPQQPSPQEPSPQEPAPQQPAPQQPAPQQPTPQDLAPQDTNTDTPTTPTIHTKENHSSNDKQITTTKRPYTCDICKKAFTQSGSLSIHKRIHTGVKPYSCEVCNMKFTTLGTWTNHKRVHTQVRPYTCKICKKGYKRVSDLTYHERIHTGVKPYCCEICKKAFRLKSGLTEHSRIHTGIKPYTCEICQRPLTSIKALLVHNKTHTGEKPYTCDICNKQFAQKGNLKSHIGTHAARRSQAGANNKSVYDSFKDIN